MTTVNLALQDQEIMNVLGLPWQYPMPSLLSRSHEMYMERQCHFFLLTLDVTVFPSQ